MVALLVARTAAQHASAVVNCARATVAREPLIAPAVAQPHYVCGWGALRFVVRLRRLAREPLIAVAIWIHVRNSSGLAALLLMTRL